MAPAVSIQFDTGADALAAGVDELAQSGAFSIASDRPEPDSDIAAANSVPSLAHREILKNGLSFELAIYSAPSTAHQSRIDARYGVDKVEQSDTGFCMDVWAGAHIRAGAAALPVLRSQMACCAALAGMAGARAVHWAPARAAMGPQYFRTAIETWLGEGTFPALGLTSLIVLPDGGLCSQGLDFLIGQEVYLDPILCEDRDAATRIAARFIHELAHKGPQTKAVDTLRSELGDLRAEPSPNGRFLRILPGQMH